MTLLLALFIAGDLETGVSGHTAPSARAVEHASTLFADLTVATDFRAGIASTQRLATKAGDRELALPVAPISVDGHSGRPHRHAADTIEPRAGSTSVPEARAPPTRTAMPQ